MSRSRSIAGMAALAVVAAVMLILPALSAARGSITLSPATTTGFALKSSKGYRITVFAGKNTMTGKGFVSLSAVKGHAVASYEANGTATATRIKAKFGGLGKVSVAFKQIGRPRKTPPGPGCRGHKGTTLKGVWKGRIRFRGEHGYTSVNVRSARGSVLKSAKQTCTITTPGGHGTILDAFKSSPNFTFSATKPNSSSKVSYIASTSEVKGGLSIIRTVSAKGPASGFTFNVPAGTATVKPPGPFHGQGNLAASAFTGTLKVSFPGKNNFALAGPGVAANVFSE